GLNEEQLQVPHAGTGADTEVEYRLHWARTYLKKCGLIDNSTRGIWALTPKGTSTDAINPYEIVREVNQQLKTQSTLSRQKQALASPGSGRSLLEKVGESSDDWRSILLDI